MPNLHKLRPRLHRNLLPIVKLSEQLRADLQLCNRMSYVVETAIGIEDKGSAATRGWFRIDPGQCRVVLQGEVQAESLYVHARALPVYGASPMPQGGHADLCVGNDNFILAGARACTAKTGQKLARFTAIKPSETEKGLTAYLAEEAEYSDDQARDALRLVQDARFTEFGSSLVTSPPKVATSLASTTGLRNAGRKTAVPTDTLRVRAATAASVARRSSPRGAAAARHPPRKARQAIRGKW